MLSSFDYISETNVSITKLLVHKLYRKCLGTKGQIHEALLIDQADVSQVLFLNKSLLLE